MAVELFESDHVFTCRPDVFPNGDKYGHQVTVKLKAVPQPGLEAHSRVLATVDVEARTKKEAEFIASKVVDIDCDCELCRGGNGIKVGSRYVSTFDGLREVAQLNELSAWISLAIRSARLLTEAEIKN